jgi:hypothetical protein
MLCGHAIGTKTLQLHAKCCCKCKLENKTIMFGLTNKYPSTWDGMKVNIKDL